LPAAGGLGGTELSSRCGSPIPGASTLMTSAPKSDSIVAAAGAAIKLAISTTLSPANTGCVACVVMVISLNECAQAGDGLADDQRLHLAGALVGVEGFGVGNEASDVVIENNPVAAEQLPGPVHGFAHPRAAEGLRQRGLLVAVDTFVLQLGQADHHPGGRRGITEHLDQQVLNHLELSDRPAELRAFLGVLQRKLIGGELDAYCLPRHTASGPAQDFGRVTERGRVLQPVGL